MVWRVLYWLLDSDSTVRATSVVLRALALVSRRPIDEGLLSMLERNLVVSGWPHQSQGWTNLHMSRFLRRVRRYPERRQLVPKTSPRRIRGSLRIGFVGRFSGLLGFPRELFDASPPNVTPCIFDIEYQGRSASYLQHATREYTSVTPAKADLAHVRDLAEAINASDLDMLVNVNWKADAYALLDAVSTPCIADFCG